MLNTATRSYAIKDSRMKSPVTLSIRGFRGRCKKVLASMISVKTHFGGLGLGSISDLTVILRVHAQKFVKTVHN